MNYTRVFSGAYVEPEGAFKITRNTLAPRPDRFVAPWARSAQPGYANGGNKFDLTRWDEAYFARLKDFVAHAATRNVVVELTLFCPMYDDVQWQLSPDERRQQRERQLAPSRAPTCHTLDKHGGLLADPGGAHPQARHRAEPVRQPVLRDLQRAVLRRRDDAVAASHRGRDRRDRARAARETPDCPEHRQQDPRRSRTRIRRSRSSTSITRRRRTPSP